MIPPLLMHRVKAASTLNFTNWDDLTRKAPERKPFSRSFPKLPLGPLALFLWLCPIPAAMLKKHGGSEGTELAYSAS